MFAWFDSVRIFISFLWLFNFVQKGFSDFLTYCIFTFARNFVIHVNFSFVWILWNVAVAIICWHERHRDILHGVRFLLVTFCLNFRSFWLWLIVLVPTISLNNVFMRKAMTGVDLNSFPNVLLIFNMWQCLLIISLIFGKVGLCVTGNGITFLPTTLALFNRVDLSRLSNFSIWFWMMFSFYPFSMNCLTKSFEYFFFYSSEFEQTRFILNCKEYSFLVKDDV